MIYLKNIFFLIFKGLYYFFIIFKYNLNIFQILFLFKNIIFDQLFIV